MPFGFAFNFWVWLLVANVVQIAANPCDVSTAEPSTSTTTPPVSTTPCATMTTTPGPCDLSAEGALGIAAAHSYSRADTKSGMITTTLNPCAVTKQPDDYWVWWDAKHPDRKKITYITGNGTLGETVVSRTTTVNLFPASTTTETPKKAAQGGLAVSGASGAPARYFAPVKMDQSFRKIHKFLAGSKSDGRALTSRYWVSQAACLGAVVVMLSLLVIIWRICPHKPVRSEFLLRLDGGADGAVDDEAMEQLLDQSRNPHVAREGTGKPVRQICGVC